MTSQQQGYYSEMLESLVLVCFASIRNEGGFPNDKEFQVRSYTTESLVSIAHNSNNGDGFGQWYVIIG